ncbi:yhr097c-like protein [Moniliophthora roreri MCA 2997]|uniref:Yhr097c-like protein n=2 Tax=Moniliophthora roreri TaxID=221103 RepID=V2XVV9_MONRO|nr:yhr097c-like protein [Moniliophthora roreri MCA 2997]KAI3621876.1 yhr097c-like protein [Moniliophthora roreri]
MAGQESNPFLDPPRTMEIEKAVRETVTVRGGHRIGRSHTQLPAPPAKQSAPSPRRSQSQDSAPKVPPKSSKKKGSQHADVIDRLDYSGVGGPMFHHDGPFDACAPSRNRHRNKAPMMAWSQDPNQMVDLHSGDSPYPAPNADAYNGFSSEPYYDQPKKKVDVLAEAWGIHEPEPFEEFSAGGGARGGTPASSIYNGKESNKGSKRSSRDGRDHREVYREYLEDPSARVNRNPRRGGIPPPQPIFVPDPTTPPLDQPIISSSPGSAGFPKRNKSLMQRIRKMRDSPNVPVGADYDETPSSPGFPSSPNANSERERPTHRSQNSFLGRFGNSRSPPPSEPPLSEPYVFIDPTTSNKEKELPPAPLSSVTPKETVSTGYFDAANGTSGTSPGAGLGRKTSLMKKVGRVVRGQR